MVELAVCDYRDSGTVAAREYLRGALERLCVVLLLQMDRDEDEAASIVAATITSAEWDAWIYELLRTTSLAELTWERRWLTDHLDAESRSIAAHAFRICHRSSPHSMSILTARRRIRVLWSVHHAATARPQFDPAPLAPEAD
ncbi:hypothetical protein [Rhodococcus sp. WAY2]|uniref:hypothetical protein n=1 Tax=Rhodococcus sp. WAY2 TaxID=2663121 RepID=UPI001357D8B0|nr:hypothetical protein [Rhodococcus sp. WAY2]